MDNFKTYLVICNKCQGKDELKITAHNQVFYKNHTPIIAARFRPDMKWGFECSCGNDSRLAYEERDSLDYLVKGSIMTIKTIAKNLARGNERRFKMEAI